jgi:hypothetical protein
MQLFARIPWSRRSTLRSAIFCAFFPSSGQGSDLKRVVLRAIRAGKVIGFVTAESGTGARRERAGRRRRCLPADELHDRRLHVFLPRDLLEPTTLSIEAGMRLALMGGVQSSPPPGPSSR